MKYTYKEVINDTEAKRFAKNLCNKNRERFPTLADAVQYVFKVRTVVSDEEFARMQEEHQRRLAREIQRDDQQVRPAASTGSDVNKEVGA